MTPYIIAGAAAIAFLFGFFAAWPISRAIGYDAGQREGALRVSQMYKRDQQSS